MQQNPIIEYNFTLLLRAGAFNVVDESVKPMSLFKWRKLYAIAQKHGVEEYIVKGADLVPGNKQVPKTIFVQTSVKPQEETPSQPNSRAKKYQKALEDYQEDHDTSAETYDFFNLLVSNINTITEKGKIDVKGMINIGLYLREKGDKIDFVALNDLIDHFHVKKIASFIASLLVDVFNFEPSEFEFMELKVNDASMYYRSAISCSNEKDNVFTFAQLLKLAPLETLKSQFFKRVDSIVNVEE